MTFHCLIVGSRDYTDYASFKAKCDALLADKTDIEIVSGGASGTDALAERYAHEHGYSLQVSQPIGPDMGNGRDTSGIARCTPTFPPLPTEA